MNLKLLSFQFLFLFTFIFSTSAIANDSIGRVASGGITLSKNNHIRMASEVLEISTKTIRVKYQFINESKKDITETVVFPMPSYRWNPGMDYTEKNIKPLESFKLQINGKTVATQNHRIARLGGKDVTAKLREIGLSDQQIFKTFGDCIIDAEGTTHCALSTEQKAKISKLNPNRKPQWNAEAPWEVVEAAHWKQTFPAGKTIEVTHEYAPFVGMSIVSPFPPESQGEACLEEGSLQALEKKIVKKGPTQSQVLLRDVEYILGTGRNWKGPISSFTLRVKKDSSNQVISLCFPGKPKKINDKTLEFTQSNFLPPDRLIVHFYEVE